MIRNLWWWKRKRKRKRSGEKEDVLGFSLGETVRGE